MFEGKSYIQKGGYKGWAIQFAGQSKTPGVATTAYSYGMTEEERYEMARRITAALNLARNFTTDQIEDACQHLPERATSVAV